MLLELAIGDAYGIPFEFVSDAEFPRNDLSGYHRHPRYPIAPGGYSDDTQMSIAVAEAVLSGAPFTKRLFAHHFVTTFQRDPRDAYARHLQRFLESVSDADDFLARIQPDSERSGAAMRAGPIGTLPTPAQVIEVASIQASVTHDTPNGRAAACAAALMTHYFLYDVGPKADLPAWLEEHLPGHSWSRPWAGKVWLKGRTTVRAALTAIVQHDTQADVLRACVAYTGDTDTVSSIAMAAASCSREINPNLPSVLYEGLEDGPYGRSYLEALDARLLALAHTPAV